MTLLKKILFIFAVLALCAGAFLLWRDAQPLANVGGIQIYRRDVRYELKIYKKLKPSDSENWDLALDRLIESMAEVSVAQAQGLLIQQEGAEAVFAFDEIQPVTRQILEKIFPKNKQEQFSKLIMIPALAYKRLNEFFRGGQNRREADKIKYFRLMRQSVQSPDFFEKKGLAMGGEIKVITLSDKKIKEIPSFSREPKQGPNDLGERIPNFFIMGAGPRVLGPISVENLPNEIKKYEKDVKVGSVLPGLLEGVGFDAIARLDSLSADGSEKTYSVLFFRRWDCRRWLKLESERFLAH